MAELAQSAHHIPCGFHAANLLCKSWDETRSEAYPKHLLLDPMPNESQREAVAKAAADGRSILLGARHPSYWAFLVATVTGTIQLEDKGTSCCDMRLTYMGVCYAGTQAFERCCLLTYRQCVHLREVVRCFRMRPITGDHLEKLLSGNVSPHRSLFAMFVRTLTLQQYRLDYLSWGKHGETRYFDGLEDTIRLLIGGPELWCASGLSSAS